MLIPFFLTLDLKLWLNALNAWIWNGLHLRAKEQWNEIDLKKKSNNTDILVGSAKRPTF